MLDIINTSGLIEVRPELLNRFSLPMEITIHLYKKVYYNNVSFGVFDILKKIEDEINSRCKMSMWNMSWEQSRHHHTDGSCSFLNAHFGHFKCFTFETVMNMIYRIWEREGVQKIRDSVITFYKE